MGENKVLYIMAIICAIIMSTGLGYYTYQTYSLKKYAQSHRAELYEIVVGVRGRLSVKYRYCVNGIYYQSTTSYMPKRDSFQLGDSCEIIYSAKDHGLANVLRNEDKSLKIVRR